MSTTNKAKRVVLWQPSDTKLRLELIENGTITAKNLNIGRGNGVATPFFQDLLNDYAWSPAIKKSPDLLRTNVTREFLKMKQRNELPDIEDNKIEELAEAQPPAAKGGNGHHTRPVEADNFETDNLDLDVMTMEQLKAALTRERLMKSSTSGGELAKKRTKRIES